MKARIIALMLVLTPASAAAGLEDSLGLGPDAMSLGGSFAARGGSFASTYYNPAGLSPLGEHEGFFELEGGFVYAHPTLHVTGVAGNTLLTPQFDPSANNGLGGYQPSAHYVDDTGGFLVGARFSVGKPFKIDGLNFGMSLFIPGQLFRWTTRPDDDVQWALMEDRTQVISVHGGLGWRIDKYLSIGAAVRVLFNAQTNTTGTVPPNGVMVDPKTGQLDTTAQLGTDSQVYAQAYPIIGVLFTPIDRLRIGLVYRNASYVNDWGTTRIDGVPDLGTIGYPTQFAHYYEPLEVTLAAGFDVTPKLDVSVDLTYERWSDALSTNNNFWGPGRWGDTVVPAAGLRWQAAFPVTLMAGYRYQRSPLDNLGGPSNLLDCDRHVASLGLDLHVGRLVHAPSFDLHLKGALQYTVLVDRTETKDPRRFPSDPLFYGNPGYPSYTYGGHMVATQATLEARW